jgi:hypothetical protein
MDFDHRDAAKKKHSIAQLVTRLTAIEIILKEIKKCDLVCANCHRQRTYDRHHNIRA